ncbi:CPBP family intramembrane glutamic endopeptidase [Zavarzinella formosa]|uniref:CPBP family intramembrane glutamic endopeptidase n=1 Tax=Zavarzinella formosa TaxID=360055 RepID=UPI000306878B|nr:CPBP family intramembrane glutamic endopeptidase [Zavarzinella formosa]
MRPSRSPVLWFFAITYAITGMGIGVLSYCVANRLPFNTWMPYAPYLTGTAPSLAGLVMLLWLYRLEGIRRLAVQFHPALLRQNWPVLAVCLLLPLGVAILTVKVAAMFGDADSPLSPRWLAKYLHVAVIGQGFLGAGIFEEIGWRGFALPHLQRRCSALTSSLLIGVVWACWHLQNCIALTPYPVFLDPFPWARWAVYVPTVMAYSVIFTWVYNSTGGSLLAVVLLHGAIDAPEQLFQPDPPAIPQLWLGLPYMLIAAGLTWRYGAANLSRRARVVA